MFAYTIATILFASGLASAAPALAPRACQVSYPAALGFPINYNIHQGANGANAQVNALTFSNIPPNSYGCTLQVLFPANYPIASSGSSAINVIATSTGAQETLFGTLTLKSGPQPTKLTVNSAVCSRGMSYRLEIASKTEAGSVAFSETLGAGFVMTYNC
ncbi:hypothetical protein ACEQ8H_006071 [Pleosporales sp. CAS-2024a]